MNTASVSPIQPNIGEDYHYPRRKRKRSNKIIHVTIRPRSDTRSARHKLIKTSNSSRSIPTTIRIQPNNSGHISVNRVKQRHRFSSKNDIRPAISKVEAWSDRQGTTIDFHRNKKKKFPRRCVIGSLVVLSILLLIAMTILLVLLLKQKSTQSMPVRTAILRWNTTGITVAGVTDILGNQSNLLNTPRGITLDYSYSLYIADFGNQRVQKYLRGASSGTTVAGNGSSSSSPTQLAGPSDVVVDANKNIFVADLGNNRIQLWSEGATSGITVAGSTTGVSGNTSNLLSAPYALDFDSSTSTIYVADSTNNRIIAFTLGSLSGITVSGGNGAGLNNTQVWSPVKCYFDSPSNSLIIGNTGTNNIVRWILGDNHWTLIAGAYNGTFGNTSTLFQGPRDLTLDPMGNLYVADKDNHRVQFFFAGQSDGTTIAGVTGINGNDSTLLNLPKSVALDNQLNLYVSDANNHRIQKFLRY